MTAVNPVWAKRSPAKQEVRDAIWTRLETEGLAVGPAHGNIPNFVGADLAADALIRTPEWQRAATVKCNPDPPQIPLRLRALYAGKTLYVPVPALTREFPYLRLDPARLAAAGVSFELAATSEGYMMHGERIGFEDVPMLDFFIVGSVAVTRAGGRTGKGAGFADLEAGIFQELGRIPAQTPVVTSVHSVQLVEDAVMVMLPHDCPLDMIGTDQGLIRTGHPGPRPKGVSWDMVQPDQFADIPFLTELRARSTAWRGAGGAA